MLNWQCYPQFAVYSEGHNTKGAVKLQVVSASFNLFVTAQWGGGGNAFHRCTKCPTSKCMGFLVACAGQDRRRVCSSECSGTIVCGPVLTAFGQSFHGEKHHHLHPELRLHKMNFFSMISSKYIDVLVTGATSSWQLYRP